MIEQRSPSGLIDQKEASVEDIEEAVLLYHQEEKITNIEIMNFDGDIDQQREVFEAERGIYEISFVREWAIRNFKVVFCNIENIVNFIKILTHLANNELDYKEIWVYK